MTKRKVKFASGCRKAPAPRCQRTISRKQRARRSLDGLLIYEVTQKEGICTLECSEKRWLPRGSWLLAENRVFFDGVHYLQTSRGWIYERDVELVTM